jgi:diguanylate cyclase (GGDEF)-like protein
MQRRTAPELTIASRLLLRATRTAQGWSSLARWAAVTAGMIVVMLLDIATGAEVTMVPFYLIVAAFGAWVIGERQGLLIGLTAVAMGVGIRHWQYLENPQHAVNTGAEIWNAGARTITTGLVVLLVSGMRAALDLERWRATTDGLTGVLNKAAFRIEAEAVIAQARSAGHALILCYMDLDGFKLVNDRHGHSAGDEVLRVFAKAATDAIREGDLFARIGGDEFVALLSVPTSAQGDWVAELVHRRLSHILANTGLPVSCSMGALVTEGARLVPFDIAVQLADQLMYEVKRAGKNALRIGRIADDVALTSPAELTIQSETGQSSRSGKRFRTMEHDRRVA